MTFLKGLGNSNAIILAFIKTLTLTLTAKTNLIFNVDNIHVTLYIEKEQPMVVSRLLNGLHYSDWSAFKGVLHAFVLLSMLLLHFVLSVDGRKRC